MNVNRRCVWIFAILIGSFFGYLVFKSRYTLVTYSPKLQESQNHGGAKTANTTERALTESVATSATEIPGDERLQIGFMSLDLTLP